MAAVFAKFVACGFLKTSAIECVVQKSLSYAQVEIGILFLNDQNIALGHTSDRLSHPTHSDLVTYAVTLNTYW